MMDAPRKTKVPKLNLNDVVSYRKALGENQSVFWTRFGVTQSGGSRYESGRNIPKPVRMLLTLFASGKLTDEDLLVAAGGKPKKSKAKE
jgi:DNA-binding transcriptional regulator YiaG